MKKFVCLCFPILMIGTLFCAFQISSPKSQAINSWIRINLMGYQPDASKVAVWVSKETHLPDHFELVEQRGGKVVYRSTRIKNFGKYGPFVSSCRLNFTEFKTPGRYRIRVGDIYSPELIINEDVYRHTADFALKYMRQQRSGYNPYLKDSCHTGDGYTLYGPMPDSTHIDVSGGWHDASDYLQYATTSANAVYHLLAAYRDFPEVFEDHYSDNGLEGKNGKADVLDEADWGLKWLLKMHPRKNWLFNQIADDRDHKGLRLPTKDSVDYGKGKERPVYFANGLPQGLGKYKNRATGAASVAGKFSSAFALGSKLYQAYDMPYAVLLAEKAKSAYAFGLAKPGTQQTAPNRAPYFYEEDNWTDDMELAAAQLYDLSGAKKYLQAAENYADQEPVTPWMGADTARHYQWYPFHNFGHYELSKKGYEKTTVYYRKGLEKVWNKAKENAFYRGIPFIWCSNNLTVSFTIQASLYQKLTGDQTYEELAQSNFDWLFGCNPWGTSMVVGLPEWGNTPKDPHSAFTHLYNYPVNGGLVDGPVYGSLYKNLIGIKLYHPDEYADFQSDLVVYHDDFGDYSSNEPTMDGTASLVYLLASFDHRKARVSEVQKDHGALIRGDTKEKKIALVFTGDQYADGGIQILNTLEKRRVKASFFLTGRFYDRPEFRNLIGKLRKDGHYLGPHSDQHLLYCDWKNRDSLLLDQNRFLADLNQNYRAMAKHGIRKEQARFFLPPFEWYNGQIADWTKQEGLVLVNYTPGTRSNADYTWTEPGKKEVGSQEIYTSILDREQDSPNGLNGFILLLHIGTDARRIDKFYPRIAPLLDQLQKKGYRFVRINELPGISNFQF
ncbi:glycoside hydrolase family 9 protein [Pedobacter nutrimenti]|jgi:peptidoglycan/xylan/chitin deacetylase (PgdA/CDA1 family)|nr:glycoside hydrolase family 9 protein [Pedobacter nutrimenti]